MNDCSRKVDTFGLPSTFTDSDANREIFEEQDRHPGLEEVNVGCTVMSTTQQVIVEQLERFATEV